MPPNSKIQRQIRIHVENPNHEYSDEEHGSTVLHDIKPISNRNMIQKLKSMQSLDEDAVKQIRNTSRRTKRKVHRAEISKEYHNYCKKQADLFLNHGAVQSFILTITTWAIFGDDIRLLCMSPLVDNFFSIINWLIMCVFIVEYGLNVYIDQQYAYTVFSALDILSIISMVPMDNLADAAQNIIFLNADGGTVARTGRAAKVGAKAGRIVKATRFLRLGRLVMEAIDTKEVKMEYKRRQSSAIVPDMSAVSPTDVTIERAKTLDDRPANCLSHRLSKELTVKVVIIIFLLLVVYQQIYLLVYLLVSWEFITKHFKYVRPY